MDYGIFNMCTDVNACDCTRGCTDTIRESSLKVDSGRKTAYRSGGSNLRRRRACPMLYQLSYITTLISLSSPPPFHAFFSPPPLHHSITTVYLTSQGRTMAKACALLRRAPAMLRRQARHTTTLSLQSPAHVPSLVKAEAESNVTSGPPLVTDIPGPRSLPGIGAMWQYLPGGTCGSIALQSPPTPPPLVPLPRVPYRTLLASE